MTPPPVVLDLQVPYAFNSYTLMSANHEVLSVYGKDGKVLAAINLGTGRVTLHGNPNEAARTFWKAIELNFGVCKK